MVQGSDSPRTMRGTSTEGILVQMPCCSAEEQESSSLLPRTFMHPA